MMSVYHELYFKVSPSHGQTQFVGVAADGKNIRLQCRGFEERSEDSHFIDSLGEPVSVKMTILFSHAEARALAHAIIAAANQES